MTPSLARVFRGLPTLRLRSGVGNYRQRSTTSSIRAGLQAERGSTGGYVGRNRPVRSRGDVEAPFPRPSSQRERYPSLGRRGPAGRSDSFASRDSPSRGFDRTAARRDSRFGDARRSTEAPVGSRFTSRTQSRHGEGSEPRRDLTDDNGDEKPSRKERRAQFWADRTAEQEGEEDADGWQIEKQPVRSSDRPRRNFDRPQHDSGRSTRVRQPHKEDDYDGIPMPVPYTTASSQFIYGANTVLAALRAKRRRIYKLYMHKRSEADNIAQIRRTATALGVEIVRTADTALLNRLSEDRPHNGVVLEVSGIPARPVLSLERWNERAATFNLELAEQDAEQAVVNGTDRKMRNITHSPLVVFLDGVTDPGNVGNIIRTAHFFGADAVAIAKQTCASITSPVLAKASAGACEAIPIFSVPHASGFIFSSRQQGWEICAAVAPADLKTDAESETRQHFTTQQMLVDSPLAGKPCILMLGAEGEGLRDNLRKKADVFVTIAQTKAAQENVDVGVDSLNVATAGALLINAFASGSRISKHHAKPGSGETELGI